MATTLRKRRTLADIPVPEEMKKTLAAIRKQYGDKSVISGNEMRQPWRIPTGVFSFDLATMGGIPHSRISMVHGPKHSGKSYMSDRIIMGAQQTLPDQQVVKVDVEGTHDNVWSSKTGVDNDALLLVQPDSGEQAIDITVAMVHTAEVSLVVIDSLAALVPIKEQDASAEDSLVAMQSRLITSMLRKVSSAQIKERKRGHHVTVQLVNQQRSKIGGWAPPGQEAIGLPGGKALGHFTTLEWRMKNKENMRNAEGGAKELDYNDHAFTIEKNKLNAGYRTGEFRMLRRDDDTLGLTEAEIDDAPIMLSYAKIAGWYTGSGKGGYTLNLDGYEPVRVANADEMVRTLYGDRELMWALRCQLIAMQSKKLGMPDWYLDYILTGATDES